MTISPSRFLDTLEGARRKKVKGENLFDFLVSTDAEDPSPFFGSIPFSLANALHQWACLLASISSSLRQGSDDIFPGG
jgi:hypothetical protein